MEDAGQAGVPNEAYVPKDTPQPPPATGPAAAPSATASAFASAPAPQVPTQPAVPKVTGLPMSALLNTPEPAVQVSTDVSHPVSAQSEAPRTNQPVSLNGWNGSHQGTENRPSSELPRAQAPPPPTG
jgi:hypothetical protein